MLGSVRGWTWFASNLQVQRLPRLSPGRRCRPLLVQCVRAGCVLSFPEGFGTTCPRRGCFPGLTRAICRASFPVGV